MKMNPHFLLKRPEKYRRITGSIHDLRFTIHKPFDKLSSPKFSRRFAQDNAVALFSKL